MKQTTQLAGEVGVAGFSTDKKHIPQCTLASVLLFQKRFHQGLVDGSITLTIRRWERPHVKPGGRYRVHPIGVVQVEAISIIREHELTPTDALSAGFASLQEMTAYLKPPPGELFKVTLRHAGQADHVDAAMNGRMTKDEIADTLRRISRLEKNGAWVKRTMKLIEKHPQVAASQLAKKLKRETLPFKVDVRKLKRLGLTMSFEVGYELSPKGKMFLKQLK